MNVVARQNRQIARPLKVIIPMIQSELQQGNSAGREHYTEAGVLLNEAKEQVAHGSWGSWLRKNFDMHPDTARVYMRWAREQQNRSGAPETEHTSLRQMRGVTEHEREQRQSTQHQQFRRVLRDVSRDLFVQERQATKDEVELHRDLAEELIDIGYRALATKLHPDRGGTKDAMARLNRVRDELKQIAQTRRFV